MSVKTNNTRETVFWKYEDKGIRQRLQGSTKIKKKDKYIKERQGLLSKTNIKWKYKE